MTRCITGARTSVPGAIPTKDHLDGPTGATLQSGAGVASGAARYGEQER